MKTRGPLSAALLMLLLPAAACAATSSDSLPKHILSSWEKLGATLSDALDLEEKQEKLPKSSLFGQDQVSNRKKFNELLDDALDMLLQGEANDMRKKALRLRHEIPNLRLEADALRNKRVGAPEKSKLSWLPSWVPKTRTRSELDASIAELDRQIEEKEKAMTEINDKIAVSLRGMGLELDDAQIEILLSSVTGDDLFQNAVIFTNVKHVVEKLADLSRQDRDNIEINRRYSGMYLVLNDMLIYTQEGLIKKIDDRYKPMLASIRKEAELLRREALTKSRSSQYTKEQQESFRINADSNSMTGRVAALYVKLLDGQRASIDKSLSDLRRNRDLAENTYRTVKSSGDLRTLIRSGLDAFDAVAALSMPDIQPFKNEAIRKEFEEINRRLYK